MEARNILFQEEDKTTYVGNMLQLCEFDDATINLIVAVLESV